MSSSLVPVLVVSVAAAALVCGYGPDISGFAMEAVHQFHATKSMVHSEIKAFPNEVKESGPEMVHLARRSQAEARGMAGLTRELLYTVRAYIEDGPRRLARVSTAHLCLIFALCVLVIGIIRPRKRDDSPDDLPSPASSAN